MPMTDRTGTEADLAKLAAAIVIPGPRPKPSGAGAPFGRPEAKS